MSHDVRPADGTDRPPANAAQDRLTIEFSYGIPDDGAGPLPLPFVAARLSEQETFWVSTTLSDRRPHARPV